jgi:putative SOS response-associated peptidase YedK
MKLLVNRAKGRRGQRFPEAYADRWSGTPLDWLVQLLVPHPAEKMIATPANPAVNSPKNDGSEYLAPAA